MLARGFETLKFPYNPLVPMETNVEKLFARLCEVLKHLNLHVTILFYWQLAKKKYY